MLKRILWSIEYMSIVLYSKSVNLLLELIPKCGTSSFSRVVFVLDGEKNWDSKDNPRLKEKYSKLPNGAQNIDRITIIRNPFTRILSAFSNKRHRVLGHRKTKGSYEDFNKFLNNVSDRFEDHHFKPMTQQLKRGRYKKIFCLENLTEFWSLLETRISNDKDKTALKFMKEGFKFNSTDAWEKYNHYLDDKNIKRIIKLYQKDFDLLGYSKNKDDVLKPCCIKPEWLKAAPTRFGKGR